MPPLLYKAGPEGMLTEYSSKLTSKLKDRPKIVVIPNLVYMQVIAYLRPL